MVTGRWGDISSLTVKHARGGVGGYHSPPCLRGCFWWVGVGGVAGVSEEGTLLNYAYS